MKGFRPPRPTGSSPKARFDIWVYDTLVRLNFIDSPTVKFNRRTTGISADAVVRVSGGTSAPPASPVTEFEFIQSWGDYVIGKNTTTGGLVRIAKPYKHRNSNTTELDDGILYTLSYPQNIQSGSPPVWNPLAFVSRNKTNGSVIEYQRITPGWTAQSANPKIGADKFYAVEVSFNTNIFSDPRDTLLPAGAVTWLDDNREGRAWAATPDGKP